tara:strand:- start:1800 stop:2645 length:846 start_codon:yes stop_codon:yes gene_type:complete
MKILITGGTGFIGSYVLKKLLNQKHELIVLGRRNKKDLNNLSWIHKVKYIQADINEEKEDWYKFLNEPDTLIHLAWENLPNYGELFHIERNLYSDYRFIKNLVSNGLKDLTITGTCFEYGSAFGELDEKMDPKPNNPYAIAKNSLRIFLEQFKSKENFNLKWIRLFYPFGKGQSSNSILSLLDKAIEDGEEIFNMSGGEQLRDYLHVELMADYIIKISFQDKINGVINCCSGNPISIRKLVEEHLKKKKEKIKLNLGFYPYPTHEPMAFWGSRKKLNKIIK